MPTLQADGSKILRIAVIGQEIRGVVDCFPLKAVKLEGGGYLIDNDLMSVKIPAPLLEPGKEIGVLYHFFQHDSPIFVDSSLEYDGLVILANFGKWLGKSSKADQITIIEDCFRQAILQSKQGSGSYREGWENNIPVTVAFDVSGKFQQDTVMNSIVPIQNELLRGTFSTHTEQNFKVDIYFSRLESPVRSFLTRVSTFTAFRFFNAENEEDIPSDFKVSGIGDSPSMGIFDISIVIQLVKDEKRKKIDLGPDIPTKSVIDWYRLSKYDDKIVSHQEVADDMNIGSAKIVEKLRKSEFTDLDLDVLEKAMIWWYNLKTSSNVRAPMTKQNANSKLTTLKKSWKNKQPTFTDVDLDYIPDNEEEEENPSPSPSPAEIVSNVIEQNAEAEEQLGSDLSAGLLGSPSPQKLTKSLTPLYTPSPRKIIRPLNLGNPLDSPAGGPSNPIKIDVLSAYDMPQTILSDPEKTAGTFFPTVDIEDYLQKETITLNEKLAIQAVDLSELSKQNIELVKVVVLGQTGVGKTSFVKKSLEGSFSNTLNYFMIKHDLEEDLLYDKHIRHLVIEIVDDNRVDKTNPDNQEEFYSGAIAAIVMVSCDSKDSYSAVRNIIQEAREVYNIHNFVIINNKSDLYDSEQLKNIEGSDADLKVFKQYQKDWYSEFSSELAGIEFFSLKTILDSGKDISDSSSLGKLLEFIIETLRAQQKRIKTPKEVIDLSSPSSPENASPQVLAEDEGSIGGDSPVDNSFPVPEFIIDDKDDYEDASVIEIPSSGPSIDNDAPLPPEESVVEPIPSSPLIYDIIGGVNPKVRVKLEEPSREEQEQALRVRLMFIEDQGAIPLGLVKLNETFDKGTTSSDAPGYPDNNPQKKFLVNQVMKSGWDPSLTSNSFVMNPVVSFGDNLFVSPPSLPLIQLMITDWDTKLAQLHKEQVRQLLDGRQDHATSFTLNQNVQFIDKHREITLESWRKLRQIVYRQSYVHRLFGRWISEKFTGIANEVDKSMLVNGVISMDSYDVKEVTNSRLKTMTAIDNCITSLGNPEIVDSLLRKYISMECLGLYRDNIVFESELPNVPIVRYIEALSSIDGLDDFHYRSKVDNLADCLAEGADATTEEIMENLEELSMLSDSRSPLTFLTIVLIHLQKILTVSSLVMADQRRFDFFESKIDDYAVVASNNISSLITSAKRGDGESIAGIFWSAFFDLHVASSTRAQMEKTFAKKMEMLLELLEEPVAVKDQLQNFSFLSYSFNDWAGEEPPSEEIFGYRKPGYLFPNNGIYQFRGGQILKTISRLGQSILAKATTASGRSFFSSNKLFDFFYMINLACMNHVGRLDEFINLNLAEVLNKEELVEVLKQIYSLWSYYSLLILIERYLLFDVPLRESGKDDDLTLFYGKVRFLDKFLDENKLRIVGSAGGADMYTSSDQIKGILLDESRRSMVIRHSGRDMILEEMYIRTLANVRDTVTQYNLKLMNSKEKMTMFSINLLLNWKKFFGLIRFEIRPLVENYSEFDIEKEMRIRFPIDSHAMNKEVFMQPSKVTQLFDQRVTSKFGSVDDLSLRWQCYVMARHTLSLGSLIVEYDSEHLEKEAFVCWAPIFYIMVLYSRLGEMPQTVDPQHIAYINYQLGILEQKLGHQQNFLEKHPSIRSATKYHENHPGFTADDIKVRNSTVNRICETLNYLTVVDDSSPVNKSGIYRLYRNTPADVLMSYLSPVLVSIINMSMVSWTWMIPFVVSMRFPLAIVGKSGKTSTYADRFHYLKAVNPETIYNKNYYRVTYEQAWKMAQGTNRLVFSLTSSEFTEEFRTHDSLTPFPSPALTGVNKSACMQLLSSGVQDSILPSKNIGELISILNSVQSDLTSQEAHNLNVEHLKAILTDIGMKIGHTAIVFEKLADYFIGLEPEEAQNRINPLVGYCISMVLMFLMEIKSSMDDTLPMAFDHRSACQQLMYEPVYDFFKARMHESVLDFLEVSGIINQNRRRVIEKTIGLLRTDLINARFYVGSIDILETIGCNELINYLTSLMV